MPVVAVAYSGGRDSTALLHATLRAAREAGLQVEALHVHHGLSVHADAWAHHCEAQCRSWARRGWPVRFALERLALRPAAGESVEALARTARYAALARMARAAGATLVLLGHHRRDQAETLLLQALRGGGVAGLAGMPARVERDGLTWARPWLAMPRAAIDAYVRRHRLRHVEDDSNADPRFARNRLRLEVWPALARAFPQAEATLADAATWAAQARASVDEIAEGDVAGCTDARGLDLRAWERLGPARARQALRRWLQRVAGRAPSAALLERLMRELPGSGPAQWPAAGGWLRRYRGHARFEFAPPPHPAPAETALALRRAGRYPLPGWGGVLVARRVGEGGVALARLQALTLAARRGGEGFQAAPRATVRSLKKQYQALGVPAWARQGPLLLSGDTLVFVAGLGIDARVLAAPGEPQLALHWEPMPAS